MGIAITQYCGACRERRPVRGFDIRLGVCAGCKAALVASKRALAKSTSARQVDPRPDPPRQIKCPTCLQRVAVNSAGTALVDHPSERRESCAGSRLDASPKRTDALDHRLPGSFESGRG